MLRKRKEVVLTVVKPTTATTFPCSTLPRFITSNQSLPGVFGENPAPINLTAPPFCFIRVLFPCSPLSNLGSVFKGFRFSREGHRLPNPGFLGLGTSSASKWFNVATKRPVPGSHLVDPAVLKKVHLLLLAEADHSKRKRGGSVFIPSVLEVRAIPALLEKTDMVIPSRADVQRLTDPNLSVGKIQDRINSGFHTVLRKVVRSSQMVKP